MKLYLVRHGETALNEKGCYYGKTDAVLSVRGIEQAKYLQHIFKEVSFDYVVASPLVRAYNYGTDYNRRKKTANFRGQPSDGTGFWYF